MSDFSELCPLFDTGVFHEIVFPGLNMTLTAETCNALEGSCTAGAAHSGNFTFGRTVVVTKAFLRRWTANAITSTIHLDHRTTAGAAQTIFGTWIISVTQTLKEVKYTWLAMTQAADKTFTSSEILGMCIGGGTLSSGGEYDLIVRYREK
jgi:hypothetical protein